MNYKPRCQKSQNTTYTAGVTEHTLPPTRLHVYKLYFTCTYSSLPGGEPSGSKHVDDIVKIKILV